MKVVVPVEVASAKLVSTTVPFPDPTASGDGVGAVVWSAATTYAAGARVVRAETGRLYESVADGNVNNIPERTVGTTPAKWLDLGNANRWRMLRLDAVRRTVAPSPLVVEIAPGKRVSDIGIPFVQADQVLIEQFDGNGDLVKSWTRTLIGRTVRNWYDYFYAEFRSVTTTLISDVHPITGTKLRLTFTRSSGDVSVGPIVIGNAVEIGSTAMGAGVGSRSFSVVKEDSFGERSFVKRRNVPVVDLEILTDGYDVDAISDALNDIDGTVALWVGIDRPGHWYFRALMVLGFARSAQFSLNHVNKPILNLKLEGL